MPLCRLILLILVCSLLACQNGIKEQLIIKETPDCIRGALLGSRFNTFEELSEVVSFNYFKDGKEEVVINYTCKAFSITSRIREGISEDDFKKALKGGVLDRIKLVLRSPYGVLNRNDLLTFFILSRRKGQYFGEGDVSFFDISSRMMSNIDRESIDTIYQRDFSEKGYLNSFNHIFSQALATSIFSEKTADFLADVHERGHMPELITGIFTEEQLLDLEEGPLDNYIDIINNELGQELGKALKEKYKLCKHTLWTPDLLSQYMNEVQNYGSWAFGLYMKPFTQEDEMVIRFAEKINMLLTDPGGYR